MGKFHVGQRVRIVRLEFGGDDLMGETVVGRQAVIGGVGAFVCGFGTLMPYKLKIPGSANDGMLVDDTHIEPIVDDGRTMVDWASCPIDPREVAPA